MTFHGPNGEAFEIHPATAPELILRNDQGDIVARLDQELRLKPDTTAREKEKAKLCAEAHYSKALQNILTVEMELCSSLLQNSWASQEESMECVRCLLEIPYPSSMRLSS